MRSVFADVDRADRLAEVAPDACEEYVVEVVFDGRVRVVKVEALTPAHAVAIAFERCNISARIGVLVSARSSSSAC
jgi:hypothetical protein